MKVLKLRKAHTNKMEKPTTKNFHSKWQDANAIRDHLRLLGHEGLGVTELRVFDPVPLVAYVDNEDDAVRLALEMEGKTSGIYVGVQPRPLELFDKAPNCWKPASGAKYNCAHDKDIEYITTCFFDIDVVSEERRRGCPASEHELEQSLLAAQLLCKEAGLALTSTICCSGNGHSVLANLIPIPVENDEVAAKFKYFCQQLTRKIAGKVEGVRFDPVFNLSRVMRVTGSMNLKGIPTSGRPHRRAHFVTEPVQERSMALHHMIPNTEAEQPHRTIESLPKAIRCDLDKLEKCEFIRWCRQYPQLVSEPLWWDMATNLVRLEGGKELIHSISSLDKLRYDYDKTKQLINRVLERGYRPVLCKNLSGPKPAIPEKGRFYCSQINQCPAKAPMYLATLHTVYKR